MALPMIVRPLQSGDYDEWLRMRRVLWPEDTIQEMHAEMDEILADERQVVFVVARAIDGLGGFLEASLAPTAVGCKTSPVGYIEGWYVDPDIRKRGYGTQLVQAAEDWAIEQGCREMASDCLVGNTVSLIAHTALGYQEMERLIHFRKVL